VRNLATFILIALIFVAFYFVPFGHPIVDQSILNGFYLLHEYAREHVLLCLVPAFFIAGTISVMLKKDAVLKLLGPNARRIILILLLRFPVVFWLSVPAPFFRSLEGSTKKVRV